MSFGALAAELHPYARYLVPDTSLPGKKFKAVSWAEYKAAFPRVCPKKGIVDLMGHIVSFHKSSLAGFTESRSQIVCPNVMALCDSSTTHAAVEQTLPQLALGRLATLAATTRIITISEIPDNSTVNVRKRLYWASLAPPNVLVVPHGCSAHLAQHLFGYSG